MKLPYILIIFSIGVFSIFHNRDTFFSGGKNIFSFKKGQDDGIVLRGVMSVEVYQETEFY